MVLTAVNGHTAIRCNSLTDTHRIIDLLADNGYSVRVKIIKAKPNRHPRHFLVFPFGVARSTELELAD